MNDSQQQLSPPTSKWNSWFLAAVLALLVASVYWSTLSNGFIWDDETYVEDNLAIRSFSGLWKAWFQWGITPQYYPLVHTLFWVECRLWGLNPAGYHAVNMALQVIAVLLLWRVLVRLRVPGAWLAAAIFAVHPLEVETVAWVTEAKNLLSLSLALGSMLCYLRFLPPEAEPASLAPKPSLSDGEQKSAREGWWYEGSLLLYVAALLSKTVVASLPAVLLVVYWWKRGRITRRDCYLLAPYFIFGIVLGLITIRMERLHVGAQGEEWDFTFVERTLLAGRALWFYAGKLLWPHPLVFFYPQWKPDTSVWWQYLYPAAAIAVPLVLWAARQRVGRGPLAAVLIFGGVMFPALGYFNVYPFRFSFVADHFQYHAGIALIALFAATVVTVTAGLLNRHGWLAPLGAAALLVPLVIVARQQTQIYRNLITLYEHTIAHNEQSWAAPLNLGVFLDRLGQKQMAIERYREAIRKVPSDEWYRTVGDALHFSEDLDVAVAALQKTLADKPLGNREKARVYANLGMIQAKQGKLDEAIKQLLLAIEADPKHSVQTLTDLAAIYQKQEKSEEAIDALLTAVELNPNYPEARSALGQLLFKLDRPEEALPHLATAAQLRPGLAVYRENLGAALLKKGDLMRAEQQLRAAVALNPRGANAHNILGVALLKWGNVGGAIEEFQAAVAIDPNHPQAGINLQTALKAVPKN